MRFFSFSSQPTVSLQVIDLGARLEETENKNVVALKQLAKQKVKVTTLEENLRNEESKVNEMFAQKEKMQKVHLLQVILHEPIN